MVGGWSGNPSGASVVVVIAGARVVEVAVVADSSVVDVSAGTASSAGPRAQAPTSTTKAATASTDRGAHRGDRAIGVMVAR